MENASKALLMAGGVLIGLLILALAVYLFTTFGAQSREIQEEIQIQQLTQYNAQYTIYVGREDITIYEIISVANLAKENNEYYKDFSDFATAYKVEVDAQTLGVDVQTKTQQELQGYLQLNSEVENNGNLKTTFKCTNVEYHDNGRVSYIKFIKNP